MPKFVSLLLALLAPEEGVEEEEAMPGGRSRQGLTLGGLSAYLKGDQKPTEGIHPTSNSKMVSELS